MSRGEVKQFLGEQGGQFVRLGSFVLHQVPVVGSQLRHFLDQDSLLNRLLHHEGVKHLEQVKAELEVAKVCGPEHEAEDLQRQIDLLWPEIHQPETDGNVQSPTPEATNE